MASKRSTDLARRAAHACAGPAIPLEVPGPEVLQFEEVAEKPSRALGDDDRIRLGDPLQARCEIRGLTDHAALLRFTRAYKIADYHEAGRDPDTHLLGASRQR
jgi:hypothetical protein